MQPVVDELAFNLGNLSNRSAASVACALTLPQPAADFVSRSPCPQPVVDDLARKIGDLSDRSAARAMFPLSCCAERCQALDARPLLAALLANAARRTAATRPRQLADLVWGLAHFP